MVSVCQKCGDPGFAVALVYCDNCQEVAEHRYCLDVIPKTFTEYVTWFCEVCKPKDPLNDEVKGCCLSSKRTKHVKKSSKKRKLSCKSTPCRSMNSTIVDGVAIRPLGHESSLSGQPSGVQYPQKCSSDQANTDEAIDIDDLKKNTMPNVPSYSNFDIEPSKKIVDHTTVATSISGALDRNASKPSQPIYEPVWRGCIKLHVGEFHIVDGVAAHLSTKASLQVLEEAQLLSESLCPEMLPRLDIWPKGFLKSGPKDENIGLYFFPQSESYEKEYAVLVDHMIENDLAMRIAGANAADLLIFTSMELPLTIWRFQAKYYLWGVFRRKDASSLGSGARNQALSSNTPEIDAESGVKKSHTRSPHSPLSNGSSSGSAS